MFELTTKSLHYLVEDYRREAAYSYRLSTFAILDAKEYEDKSYLSTAIYYQNKAAYLYAKAAQIVEELLAK